MAIKIALRVLPVVALVIGLFCIGNASAGDWTGEYTGDVMPDIASPAWTPGGTPGYTSVSGGIATVDTLTPDADAVHFWMYDWGVSYSAGYTVEVSLKVYPGTTNAAVFLLVTDGRYWTDISFNPGSINIGGTADSPNISMDTTDKFHTYRITRKMKTTEVYVDAVKVFEEDRIDWSALGLNRIRWGDDTVVNDGKADWDYIRWSEKGAYPPGESEMKEKIATPQQKILEKKGVILYAGFEDTADAEAIGDGKAKGYKGGPKFTEGKRNKALLSGDGEGNVSYSIKDNLRREEGAIEFWVYPLDWDGNDKKFHVFFETTDEVGWMLIYNFLQDHRAVFIIGDKGERHKWTIMDQDSRQFQKGIWTHVAVTWNAKEIGFYVNGKIASAPVPSPTLPTELSGGFTFGDCPWGIERNARSRLDELYIYDRALTPEEILWAYEHGLDRPKGKDVPEGVATVVNAVVSPYSSKKEIQVDVSLQLRHPLEKFTGTAYLEPSADTFPVKVNPIEANKGRAVIPYKTLSEGKYKVYVTIQDNQGKELGKTEGSFTCPGPPVWRGNKIGISDTPPPPWTPIKASENSIDCWGRSYKLGSLGLPAQISSIGEELLASPIELQIVKDGKDVVWHTSRSSLIKKNEIEACLQGSAKSSVGILEWKCTAEFDGLLRYDLVLRPEKDTSIDSMELRFPLKEDQATLCWTGRGKPYGITPLSLYASKWSPFWLLENEERGLFGFCESDEAWDEINRDDALRIERKGDSVEFVWSFSNKPRKIGEPWKFTFGLQAMPVKDSSDRWRKYLMFNSGAEAGNVRMYGSPTEDSEFKGELYNAALRYFTIPEPFDSKRFKEVIQLNHKKGMKIVPYTQHVSVSGNLPEASFYTEWKNGTIDQSSDVMRFGAPNMSVDPVPDVIDFLIWKLKSLREEFDFDGYYFDFGTIGPPSTKQEAGFGYLRDGKVRATYPVFATREFCKRIYTMLKSTGKDTFMLSHASAEPYIPVLSFFDAYLTGEQAGPIENQSYLDVYSLEQIRTEFMGHQFGIIPFFLPRLYSVKDAEKATREEFSLALLHDFNIWAICGTDVKIANSIYRILYNEFDYRDAKFLPYWKNGEFVGGQTEEIKCSVYRKPNGGALICISNLSRQQQEPYLTFDWEQLIGKKGARVIDAFTKETVPVEEDLVTIDIAPLNFRLLWVK